MDWTLSRDERQKLRSLTKSDGWRIYLSKLKEIEADADGYLKAAGTAEEWRERKGFWEGVAQVQELVSNLLEQTDETRETALERRVNDELARVLALR